jgi:parvulin-like peptidyl-prolyl isomerase
LLLFALPAVLLFGLHALIATPGRDTIVVPAETVDAVVQAKEEALLRPLTEGERAAAIEAYVKDELLLREAFARGLQRSDPQVRERLIDQVRILLADEPQAPDEADLRAFYEANREAYQSERTVTFEHVFFIRPAAEERINEVLVTLHGGAEAAGLGDRFWLGQHLERYTLRELAAVLGRDFAAAVFGQPADGWQGPFPSNRGLHLVRVLEVNEPTPLSFEQLRPYLEADWLEAQREASIDAKLAPIRARYRIEIEEPPA